jgi:cell division protein FtsQ
MSRPPSTRGRVPGSPAAPVPMAVLTVPRPPTGAAEDVSGRSRFAVRARSVRRASRRWKIGVPALLVVLVAIVGVLYWGPAFDLKDVAVPGVSASTADEVRSAAALPTGESLIRLDLAAATARVAKVRVVRSVVVARSWPNTVTITVTLRHPVAVVKDGDGGLHLADSTGTSYAEVSSAPKNLPMVTASASNPAAVQAVVEVLGALPADLRAKVDSAGASSPDSVTLKIGPQTIVWGSAEDSALKAKVLQVLRRTNHTARRIDLSAPHAPAVG